MAPLAFSAPQKDGFRKIMSDAVASKSTPAVFFGVTSADGLIYSHTEGKKLVDDPTSADIDEDTVFWLCSQTKLITTIAVLQLIEQGKIDLDTLAESVLPELANPVLVTGYDSETGRPSTTIPAKGKITLGHLLNHSSGLDDSGIKRTQANGMSELYSSVDVATFFEMMKGSLPGLPLKFEPGTDFNYAVSTNCVGFIIERLSGKSSEQYSCVSIFSVGSILVQYPQPRPHLRPPRYHICILLPDTASEGALPASVVPHKSGVIESWKGPPVIDQDPAHVPVLFGSAGLYSSQKDYLTVLRHLLQIKAGVATSPILTAASVDKLFEPTLPSVGAKTLDMFAAAVFAPYLEVPAGGAQFSRGLFVNTVDVPGKRKAGSGAWGRWANTSFFVDPTTGVGAVFGTQLAPPGDKDHNQLLDALERALYAALSAES
ncbi:beta-lactamase/transpeptidase-like protein [Mycena metata]|uniref:Beta-lactamase/transpeptidase-like protein n=1 Tax=Mycena metata TaxID=1033252 RepID=A0AAD7HHN4_9AGAR|nr:beta-lactamase/transpeptidase-like protein [Mycena metata]